MLPIRSSSRNPSARFRAVVQIAWFGADEYGAEDGKTGADDAEGSFDVGPVGEGGLVVGRVCDVHREGGDELDEDDEADQGGYADPDVNCQMQILLEFPDR